MYINYYEKFKKEKSLKDFFLKSSKNSWTLSNQIIQNISFMCIEIVKTTCKQRKYFFFILVS